MTSRAAYLPDLAILDAPLDELLAEARRLRALGTGSVVTYSPKVFIPLTKLCRDVCHYCTFAQPPRKGEHAYLTIDKVLAIASAGAAAGCHEALFTLGDKPELRYKAAREELAALGCETTLEYLVRAAKAVLDETGLLPHLNPGVLTRSDLAVLREVSVSMGIMLETSAERLSKRGGPHFGSPDKHPAVRLETLELAGELAVPFTTGLLIGIGETRQERIETLLAIKASHDRHGHIQEVIVQNFRAKPHTKMHDAPEPPLDDLLWTAAAARVILGPAMHIQCPPNLSYAGFPKLLEAGIDDWGGVSPVTIDHVNPEAPWPDLVLLERATREHGLELTARLPLYPDFVADLQRWVDASLVTPVLRSIDASGFAREGAWSPGEADALQPRTVTDGATTARDPGVREALAKSLEGCELSEDDLVALFGSRGDDRRAVFAAADALRREVNGDTVSYVVTRNINYTNVCYFKCSFCAFSKGKLAENLRGPAYLVPTEEIVRRVVEAWERGGTEVCLQGGIHPAFTGETYIGILQAVKEAVPGIHVHAFSALEVWQGAATLGLSLEEYLTILRGEGLGSLPGTAAEILDDEVRATLCPDKVTAEQWYEVHDTAHRVGLKSTTTIMFGHIETTRSWARHIVGLREQQKRSGGFTEFVPLPFIHMEAPIYLKGHARKGPTFGESLLIHAVGRLALHPHITNIQASWVKLGQNGVAAALRAGVNDLGGTLMNESISRAAGSEFGQELPPEQMEALIRANGRIPRQRTTVYGTPPAEQTRRSFGAAPLLEPINPSVNDAGLERPARLIRPGLVAAQPSVE